MLETDHTFPFTGWTTAIGFWEMVERPPHTRMAGGVEPLQGEQCWASGRAVVGVSDVGEGGWGGRPASGSRSPGIRITPPEGSAGRPPNHAQIIERVTLSRHADQPAWREWTTPIRTKVIERITQPRHADHPA